MIKLKCLINKKITENIQIFKLNFLLFDYNNFELICKLFFNK